MNVPQATPQSTFVTVLAWIAIWLSGLCVLIGLMQNVMVNFFMPTLFAAPNAPPNGAFPFACFRVFVAAFLACAIFMTFASFGLLRRRNWARLTFIVVCALGIAWSVLSILMFAFGFGLGRFPAFSAPTVPSQMDAMFKAMFAMVVVFTLGECVLLAWIISRLHSPVIRAEFKSRSPNCNASMLFKTLQCQNDLRNIEVRTPGSFRAPPK